MWRSSSRPLDRRRVLAGAGAVALVATSLVADSVDAADGVHQPGIATPPLPFLSIAAFDVVTGNRPGLVQLLQCLTGTGGRELTVTVGFGPSLFRDDRFGVMARRPAALVPLPPFPGEALDPVQSDGDLCVQVCATTPIAAHQATRTIVDAVRPYAKLRWRQTGFLPGAGGDPRGMLGFHDGTANVSASDTDAMARHVWVPDRASWMYGGTYLVMRRIRLLLDTWDRVGIADQEAVIGRRQHTNERIGAAPNAHASLAAPVVDTERILRRSYAYDAGADPNGLLDAGLVFLCFQRDPGRQFVPIQRRLAERDALNAFCQHTASAVFACPPAAAAGSWLGAGLLT
jgi:deferrochelatase/peroxidase EfeB